MGYTHLQFRGDFPRIGEQDGNGAGRELAEQLQQGMAGRGWPVTDLVREDWGWCFHVTVDRWHMLVGCGAHPDDFDGWLSFVEKPGFTLRALFKSPAPAIAQVAGAMHSIIAHDARSYARRWWTDANGVGETVEC